MSTANKLGTALVTGASTGIGAAYANRLARRGYDLILVARNRAKLDQIAQELSDETGVGVRVFPADLTVPSDLDRVERVLREDAGISLLVNNAGIAALGALADADIERLDREIRLNVLAPTRLSRAVVPGLLARNRGGIINIASVMSQMCSRATRYTAEPRLTCCISVKSLRSKWLLPRYACKWCSLAQLGRTSGKSPESS